MSLTSFGSGIIGRFSCGAVLPPPKTPPPRFCLGRDGGVAGDEALGTGVDGGLVGAGGTVLALFVVAVGPCSAYSWSPKVT